MILNVGKYSIPIARDNGLELKVSSMEFQPYANLNKYWKEESVAVVDQFRYFICFHCVTVFKHATLVAKLFQRKTD